MGFIDTGIIENSKKKFNYKLYNRNVLNSVLIGFTLAEAILTIAVIGVVAAFTIPSIINSTRDMELHTAWKKTYSDLSQTVKFISNENGGGLPHLNDHDADGVRDLFLKHMNYTNKCNQCDHGGICVPTFNPCWHMPGNLKFLDGSPKYPYGWFYRSTAVLSNGNLLFIYRWPNQVCIDNYDACIVGKTQAEIDSICVPAREACFMGCNSDTNAPDAVCAAVDVDVNGFKGPNVVGKDVYRMTLYNNSIKPVGSGAACDGDGSNCAAYWLIH